MIRFTIPPCYLFKFLLSFQTQIPKETESKLSLPSLAIYFNDPIHIYPMKCAESFHVTGILADFLGDYFIKAVSVGFLVLFSL